MRRFTVCVLLLSLVACLPGSPDDLVTTREPERDSYRGLQLEELSYYHALFDLRFAGEKDWTYQLELRSDGESREYLLHVEGVTSSQDIGDVRMVEQREIRRIQGSVTGGDCWQFQSDMDLGPAFLTPDDLFAPQNLTQSMVETGGGRIAAAKATRYAVHQDSLGVWRDLELEIWLHDARQAVLRYDLEAEGEDPLFGAGEGVITGRFEVVDLTKPEIKQIPPCHVSVPLPEQMENLLIVSGLISFESEMSLEELVAFFEDGLPIKHWKEAESSIGEEGATILSYKRGKETMEVVIKRMERGVKVEIFTGDS
jgi:hypothetical protein